MTDDDVHDDLSALHDATRALVDLVERLAAHRTPGADGDTLSDDDLEQLLRESGQAIGAWQEAFRQGIISARAPEEDEKPEPPEGR